MITKKPRSIKKILLMICLLLLVLSGFRISWVLYHQSPAQPFAAQGVLDLRDWAFNEHETISLDGEWTFYPDEFVFPTQEGTLKTDSKPDFIVSPKSWGEGTISDKSIHYGTYRLKILLPDQPQELFGIAVRDISSAARIFESGEAIGHIGNPADTLQQYESRVGTYKSFFHPKGTEVDLVIHVANYEAPVDGGITKSIQFGTGAAIDREVNLSKMMQLFVVSILLVHSLYAFGLYFISKDRLRKEIVYFGLLLIFAAFSIVVDEDKLLLTALPINATWSLKLLYLSFAGTVYFILKFIKHAFKLNNRVFLILFILYSTFTLLLLFAPYSIIMYIGLGIMLLNAFSYTFIFVQVLKIIRGGDRDAIYILVANNVNLFNVIWGIAINLNMVEIPYYPVDYLIAIAAFTGFLFKRHSRIVELNKRQTVELQKAAKTKDDFLANTSHELRNPLHGIINMAETILQDERETLSAKNKENLELIVRIGKHMSFTLNDLLDATKLQEQRIRIHPVPVNLHAVAAGVFDMVRFMTDGKNIRLTLNFSSSFPLVMADKNRLIQILLNLSHNAVKYTAEGSVTIHATHDEQMARITVSDTGIGIDEEFQKWIFQPYEQEDSSMISAGNGIGLGLTICKQLVELHGGNIFVESTPGEGSTFTFTIPLATEKNDHVANVTDPFHDDYGSDIGEETDPSIASAKTNKKDAKILVVDDDPVNLKILSNALVPDYEVVTATSGEEALELIESGEWDLVISDVMMPNMSGYELTETIRRHFTIAELPILLLTARSQLEDVYTGFQAGANDYVAKPMDVLELKARVQALTALKRSVHEQLRMEAAWLQAQIQPHFLFNTLNTIAALSEIDTYRMISLLNAFAHYLRKSFSIHHSQSVVPLDDELDLVRSYLFIEKERFGERIKVEWKIEDHLHFQIPPFSIQTIVENAIRHGILKRIDGGTLSIQITESTYHYEVSILDDGVGMEEKKLQQILSNGQEHIGKGVGIANTHRRLQQLFGKGLTIQSAPNEGTTVTFRIPK